MIYTNKLKKYLRDNGDMIQEVEKIVLSNSPLVPKKQKRMFPFFGGFILIDKRSNRIDYLPPGVSTTTKSATIIKFLK